VPDLQATSLLLACALSGLVLAGPARPTDIARVDEVIDAPHGFLGRTRAQVEARLGPPDAVEPRTVGHWRDEARREPVEALRYPGLVVLVDPRGRLRGLTLTGGGWRLPGGVGLGAARDEVEQALGEPQQSSDRLLLYLYSDAFPRTVTFHLRDDRVHRIEWSYAGD
jgi:hypothetical protein